MLYYYIKKMVPRRRPFKPRRRVALARRPYRMLRRVRPKFSLPIISCKRTFYVENWSPSTAATSGFWRYYSPSLSQLPSLSEFQALFDMYKVKAIKITLRPRYDNFAGSDTTDVTLPGTTAQGGTNVHVVIDPDSTNTTPGGTYTTTNLNAFLENGNVKSYTGNKPITIYWKPKVGDSMATGEARVRPKWMGTSATPSGIVHHGVHIFLQDTNFTGTFNQSFDVFYTYYMQFKSLK